MSEILTNRRGAPYDPARGRSRRMFCISSVFPVVFLQIWRVTWWRNYRISRLEPAATLLPELSTAAAANAVNHPRIEVTKGKRHFLQVTPFEAKQALPQQSLLQQFLDRGLERREMFAAKLAADMISAFAVQSDVSSKRAVIAGPMTPPAATDRVVVPTLGATVENGVLTVTGSNGADNIFIFAKDGQIRVCEAVKNLTYFPFPPSR